MIDDDVNDFRNDDAPTSDGGGARNYGGTNFRDGNDDETSYNANHENGDRCAYLCLN